MLLGLRPCSPVSPRALSGEAVSELLGADTLGQSPCSPVLPTPYPGWELLSWAVVAGSPLLGLGLQPAWGMRTAYVSVSPWLRVRIRGGCLYEVYFLPVL